MALWLNRSLVNAPRNGTTTHTISFTPATTGNLLVLLLEGAVTHTVPAGWVRRNQALNNTELSVYTKTATAGESSFSTTHNGSDYEIVALVYEFAAGSTWAGGISATGLGSSAANPNLTGLTGTNLLFGAVANGNSETTGRTTEWASPSVENVDVSVIRNVTDGFEFSVAYEEDSTATSFQPTGTIVLGPPKEALTFAVKVAVGGTPVTSTAGGIPTAEIFGAVGILLALLSGPVGISSAETFGTPTSVTTLASAPPGIPTGETLGAPSTVLSLTSSPTGIPTAETFGTPSTVTPSGTTSTPTGIPTGEASGIPATVTAITSAPAGIPTAAALGAPSSALTVVSAPAGIPSVETLGTPSTVIPISSTTTGISTAETFGTPSSGGALTNITATATLADRRWTATIGNRTRNATLDNRRWEGTL